MKGFEILTDFTNDKRHRKELDKYIEDITKSMKTNTEQIVKEIHSKLADGSFCELNVKVYIGVTETA